MARYIEASCRLCRREGIKLYLKGDRCYTEKCAFSRRGNTPGQHGQQKKKLSEYGIQLREKQKVRRYYGVLEKQFSNYFVCAEKMKGVTGENLLQVLEQRFDNVIYRLGLGNSRAESRQLVTHAHFTINGKKVNIPSYLLKVGDRIEIREKSKNNGKLKSLLENLSTKVKPKWLEFDANTLVGKVLAMPEREDVDLPLKEHLIVELYSK